MPALIGERLPGKNRIAAILLSATVFAFEPGPDRIELIHGRFDETRFISQDSGFKIPGACALHSYPGTSKVSRSDIGNLGVEYNNLEVNTWTESSLQPGKENGILVEVLSEIGPWFLCMNQPDLFSLLDEVGKDTQERSVINIEVLDVRRPYPNRTFYLWNQSNNLLKVVLVCYVFRHGK